MLGTFGRRTRGLDANLEKKKDGKIMSHFASK